MFVEAPFEFIPRVMAAREHPLDTKSNVNDWLRLDKDGNPVLFAPADEVPEGVEICEPLRDGETVPFIAELSWGLSEIEIHANGTYTLPAKPPAEVNWFYWHEACASGSVKRLAEMMAEERCLGWQTIRYYQRGEVACLYNAQTHSLELMGNQASMLALLSRPTAGVA